MEGVLAQFIFVNRYIKVYYDPYVGSFQKKNDLALFHI